MVTITVYLKCNGTYMYTSIEIYSEELKNFKVNKWIEDQKKCVEAFCGGYHSAEVIRKEEYEKNTGEDDDL